MNVVNLMLFEEFENSIEEWAIFMVKHGIKLFLTQINLNDRFGRWNNLKYSNEDVLKFSLEHAKELVDKNERNEMMGVVNGRGLQLTKGKYDNVWKKV